MSEIHSPSIKVNRKPVWVSLVLLIIFVMIMILSFSYSYRHSSIDKKRIALSSELSSLSLQLYTSTMSTVKRDKGAFQQVEQQKKRFEETFKALGLVETPYRLGIKNDNLDKLGMTWRQYAALLNQVLLYKDAVNKTHRYGEAVYGTLPAIQVAAEQVVLSLERENDDIGQLNMAISQLILLQKMQNNLLLMLEGRNDVEDVIKSFSNHITDLDRKLDSLMRGGKSISQAVSNREAIFYLEQIEKQFGGLSEQISALLDNATMLQQIYVAVNQSEPIGRQLFAETEAVQAQINGRDDHLRYISILAYIFGGLSLLSLLFLVYALFHDHRERLALTQAENKRNLDGIMHLRNRMTALSEGDLTVTATVSNDITGAISDSFNHTVDALRRLVAQISITSNRLNSYAQQADGTASELSRATNDTSKELLKVAVTTNTITENVDKVSRYAKNSAVVAKHALVVSRQGGEQVAVVQEVMATIQQQAGITAERVQTLTKRSKEALVLPSILRDLQEQVAQLYSSIGSDNPYSDSISNLLGSVKKARVSSEALLPPLYKEGVDTIDAMEKTVAYIADGSNASRKAAKALLAAENESLRVTTLILNIAKVTEQHSQLSKYAKQKMLALQDLTLEAFERVNETTDLINSLTTTANQLQESIYCFKLPTHVFYDGQEELLGERPVADEKEPEYEYS